MPQPSPYADNASPTQPLVTQTVALCHSPQCLSGCNYATAASTAQTSALHHSPPLAQALCHSPLPAQASALYYSPPLAQAAAILQSSSATACCPSSQPCTTTNGSAAGLGAGAGPEGLLSLDQGAQGSTRFYAMSKDFILVMIRLKSFHLTTFTPGQQAIPT